MIITVTRGIEILMGLGVQSQAEVEGRIQAFAHLLAGTNVFGPIVKPEIGVRYGLGKQSAIVAQVGRTQSVLEEDFPSRSWSVALGLNYGFALP